MPSKPTDLNCVHDTQFNIREFVEKRQLYNRSITSDVEFAARLCSARFSERHATILAERLRDSIVVDMGCGQAMYLEALLRYKPAQYYGVDQDATALEMASNTFSKTDNVQFIEHDVYSTCFKSETADIVISSEVLEHLYRPDEYLREIHRILKIGGHLSLSTPCVSMYFYPHNILRILLRRVTLRQWFREVNSHSCWEDAISWHPGLRPRILRKWLRDAGFEVLSHDTTLWYYGSPVRLEWRVFQFLERHAPGISSVWVSSVFRHYLLLLEGLLRVPGPWRYFGIRQFALCRKL